MAKKVYAVAIGRRKGIYTDWNACKRSVNGYPNARYKGFESEKEAKEWLKSMWKGSTHTKKRNHKVKQNSHPSKKNTSKSLTNYDFIVHTDGSCDRNPYGAGGIGVVIKSTQSGKKVKFREGYCSTTNNRMEIMAVIRALEKLPDGSRIHLYSDSQYVIKTINGEYSRNKNLDLWERLDQAMEGNCIIAEWIKGHAGNRDNELCDRLASVASAVPTRDDLINGEPIRTIHAHDVPLLQLPSCSIVVETKNEKRCCSDCLSGATDLSDEEKETIRKNAAGHKLLVYKRKESLIRIFGIELWDKIAVYFSDEKDIATVLRWFAHGLSVEDSIKKVSTENKNHSV